MHVGRAKIRFLALEFIHRPLFVVVQVAAAMGAIAAERTEAPAQEPSDWQTFRAYTRAAFGGTSEFHK